MLFTKNTKSNNLYSLQKQQKPAPMRVFFIFNQTSYSDDINGFVINYQSLSSIKPINLFRLSWRGIIELTHDLK